MTDGESEGLREKITRSGEDAIGRLVQDLLENPMVASALTRVLDAREKATAAQASAMGALNLPSAADIERLTRRVRSVAQRLEGVEDGVDRLEERIDALPAAAAIDGRLAAIEDRLGQLAADLGALRAALPSEPPAVSRDQERLAVPADE